ncbi:pyrroline-5-carboxylate reductase [Nitrospira sp. Kam-Ns4a]
MTLDRPVAFLGGGNMTEALVAGILKAGLLLPERMCATDILPDRRAYLAQRYGIRVGDDNLSAARQAEVLVLCVEPQVLDEALDRIAQAVTPDTLVISVAAGYPISRVLAHLPQVRKVVRAMPNTPSSVLEGVTALAIGAGVSDEERQGAEAIFASVGKVVIVEERLMDAVTGLSGSGPAYIYLIVEALADGGVKVGLPRPIAQLLATQTVLGAARMLLESGEHPAQLKDRVASPGGTTIAGLHALEQGRVRAALIAAVEAATARSAELGRE